MDQQKLRNNYRNIAAFTKYAAFQKNIRKTKYPNDILPTLKIKTIHIQLAHVPQMRSSQ